MRSAICYIVMLAGAIAFIGAVAFGASKVDGGFGEFMNESMVKVQTVSNICSL